MATRSSTPAGGGAPSGQTQLQNNNPPPQTATAPRQAVLHLRGATREEEAEAAEASGGETRRRIQWAEGVVDNEGLGRKKSKVCCIYHAPKGIDESSDESSSDSSSDSDGGDDGDDGAAKPSRKEGVGHSHGGHGHGHDHGKPKKGKGRARSPNAYERMPKNNKTGGTKEKG